MRMHVFYLAGSLSAAALLATACAERRAQYDYNNTSSRYDRDRGYSSGWTSGNYVTTTQENRTSGYGTSDTSGYGSGSVQYSGTQGGYSSGTTGGYNNGGYNNGMTGGYSGTTGTQGGYGTGQGGYNSGTTGGYSSGTTGGYSSGTAVGTNGTQGGYGTGTTGGYGTGTTGGYGTGTTGGYGTGNTTGTQGGYGTGTTGSTQGGYGIGSTGSTYERSGSLGSNQATWWNSVKSAVAVVHPIEGQSCKGTVRFTQSDRGLQVVADLEGLQPNQKVRVRINEFGDCSSATGDNLGKTFTPNSTGMQSGTTYGSGTNTTGTTYGGTTYGGTTGNNGLSNGTTGNTGTTGNGMSGMQHNGTEMGMNGSLGGGDLGTLDVDSNGRLHIDRTLDSLSIAGGENAILGRSVSIVADTNAGTQSVGTSTTGTSTTGTSTVNNPSGTNGNLSNGTLLACGVIGIGKSDSFR